LLAQPHLFYHIWFHFDYKVTPCVRSCSKYVGPLGVLAAGVGTTLALKTAYAKLQLGLPLSQVDKMKLATALIELGLYKQAAALGVFDQDELEQNWSDEIFKASLQGVA